MKALIMRYLNDIVSLAVMALMAVALIAGQADANVRDVVRDVVRSDAAFIVTLDIEGESIDAIREVLEIRFRRED